MPGMCLSVLTYTWGTTQGFLGSCIVRSIVYVLWHLAQCFAKVLLELIIPRHCLDEQWASSGNCGVETGIVGNAGGWVDGEAREIWRVGFEVRFDIEGWFYMQGTSVAHKAQTKETFGVVGHVTQPQH